MTFQSRNSQPLPSPWLSAGQRNRLVPAAADSPHSHYRGEGRAGSHRAGPARRRRGPCRGAGAAPPGEPPPGGGLRGGPAAPARGRGKRTGLPAALGLLSSSSFSSRSWASRWAPRRAGHRAAMMDRDRNKTLLLELQRAAGTGNGRCADCGEPGKGAPPGSGSLRAPTPPGPARRVSDRKIGASEGPAGPLGLCRRPGVRPPPVSLPACRSLFSPFLEAGPGVTFHLVYHRGRRREQVFSQGGQRPAVPLWEADVQVVPAGLQAVRTGLSSAGQGQGW